MYDCVCWMVQYIYFKITLLSQFKDLFRIPFHVTPDPNEKVDRGKCVFQCCISEFLLAFFFCTSQIVVTETIASWPSIKASKCPFFL